MPYIKKEDREKWEKLIEEVTSLTKDIPTEKIDGDLNYFFTSILHKTHPKGYSNYNRAIGLLECIKSELYRKKVSPYEEEKIIENGGV